MTAPRESRPAVADVFITEELDRRTPKKADYLREKRALQDLAARMADRPDEVLPRFVDLALEMTGGVSAGLSIYEEHPAPGVFRWQYLRGELEPFNGATTPRDFNPCGVTLDRNAPVLSCHPERVYDWIAEANIVVPEVLLVPLYLGGEAPLGTLWIVSDREGHFDRGHARAMTELAMFVGIALRMARSEQRLHQALDAQQLLAREMVHRVNNLFLVVEGMIRTAARESSTTDELAEKLSGRLYASARAHALVRANFGPERSAPEQTELSQIINAIVEPYETPDNPRFSIVGPPTSCAERAINGIALVFHELATNALKYGALKADAGHVSIAWPRQNGQLDLRWIEQGGPPVDALPVTEGFGSTLVERTVTRSFGGTLAYEWRRDGMAVTI